jgi:hypothetical protein
MARKSPYEVGYGKPPRSHQFPKGKSGNPKGRPKGSPNFRVALQRALAKGVVVSENGRRKSITKQDAAATQLVNKAASGDLRAIAQLLMTPGVLDGGAQAAPQVIVNEQDQKVAAALIERIKSALAKSGGAK